METEIKQEQCDLEDIKEEPDSPNNSENEFEELECGCVVCSLSRNGFKALGAGAQDEIITKDRPKHSPLQLGIPEKINWLTSCTNNDKIFCWPCLLFSEQMRPWSGNYHTNKDKIKSHSNTKAHMQSVLNLKIRLKLSTSQLNLKTENKHSLIVDRNREVIKRLIDIICFMFKHDLETKDSFCTSLIQLVKHYDRSLKIYLEDQDIKKIQTDIVRSLAATIRQNIKRQLETAHFASIILLEATDQKELSKPALIIRYVNPQGVPVERFLKIFNEEVPLHEAICDTIDSFDCGPKLIAQTCDGGSVSSLKLNHFQATIMERYPKAYFMHCFGLKLDTVLAQGCSNMPELKFFFKTLNDMADFFSKQTLWPEVSSAFPDNRQRWSQMGDLVKILNLIRSSLIELFKRFLESRESYEPETFNTLITYLKLLEEDKVFNFLLQMFSEILPQLTVLSQVSKSFDCSPKIKESIRVIEQKTNQFEHFWHKVLNKTDEEPAAKRAKTEVKNRLENLFVAIIHNLLEQLNLRFDNLHELQFIKAQKSLDLLIDADFFSQLKRYEDIINLPGLQSQISALNSSCPYVFDKGKDALSFLKFLKQNDLEKDLSEVTKLCELLLALPLSDLNISKRICQYTSKNLSGANLEFFEDFSLVFIEQEYLIELAQSSGFHDEVIGRFSQINDSLELQY